MFNHRKPRATIRMKNKVLYRLFTTSQPGPGQHTARAPSIYMKKPLNIVFSRYTSLKLRYYLSPSFKTCTVLLAHMPYLFRLDNSKRALDCQNPVHFNSHGKPPRRSCNIYPTCQNESINYCCCLCCCCMLRCWRPNLVHCW